MKPVDHVTPTVPPNWTRRIEERRRKREREPSGERDEKQPPGRKPDGNTHIVDELV